MAFSNEMFYVLMELLPGIRGQEVGLPKITTKEAKVFSRKARFEGKNDNIEGIFPACSAEELIFFL